MTCGTCYVDACDNTYGTMPLATITASDVADFFEHKHASLQPGEEGI